MAAPKIKISGQSRSDKTITVYGGVTGDPTSVTIELPAAAEPNGATSRAPVPVVVNTVGEFAHTFEALTYGDYTAAVIKASNADGESVVTTWPMRLFVPGTATPGTPRAFLPSFVAPVFSTPIIAIGANVAPFTLSNTSTTDAGGGPFTFGQPFKAGELKPGDYLVGKVAGGADLPLQFNVKATHQDGSVRHAIISGIAPVLAPGASLTVNMVRAGTGTSTVPFEPIVAANSPGFSAVVDAQIDGTTYSASANTALSAGVATDKIWIGGELVSEFVLDLPMVNSNGAAHPLLTAQFTVRHYPGANATRVDVTLENSKAYESTVDVPYTGTIKIGGVTRYNISAWGDQAAPLVHFSSCRWKKTFWHNNANPVFVKHDIDYLIDSKAVPNYDRRIKTINPSKLAEYADNMASAACAPMGYARFQRAMGTTGGRPDLGLAPDSYAAAVLTMEKTAYDMMLASGNAAGSWGIHRRDTSTGPAAGRSIDIIHWPRSTIGGGTSDSINKATGLAEKFPGSTTANGGVPDIAHQPAFAYIPYLLTGDYYYLEELLFWGNYNFFWMNPGYRQSERGLYNREQTRGQAWASRTTAECAAILPDTHPSKPNFIYWLDNNLSHYLRTYADNPDANALGIMVEGPAIVYDLVGGTDNGIGTWQDDFFTMAMGHAADLGFDKALRMLRWKAKFQIGRLLAPGTCWIHATEFAMIVRDNAESPLYTTIAECQQKSTWPSVWALPCNSPERLAEYIRVSGNYRYVINEMMGRTGNTDGYPALYAGALAYSVDANSVADGDLAWDLFETRTPKPDYSESPQFAVVPRGVALAELPPDPEDPPSPTPPAPTDSYTGLVGSTIFFGRN